MPFASSKRRLSALSAVLIWCGCVQCESSYPDVALLASESLVVDAGAVRDTLTVVVVREASVRLGPLPTELFAAPDTLLPQRSATSTVELAYRLDGLVYDQTPRLRLTAVAEGDTVFVRADGALDLIRDVCSPSRGPFAEVSLVSVRAPENVEAVIVTMMSSSDVPPRVDESLRRADEAAARRQLVV